MIYPDFNGLFKTKTFQDYVKTSKNLSVAAVEGEGGHHRDHLGSGLRPPQYIQCIRIKKNCIEIIFKKKNGACALGNI